MDPAAIAASESAVAAKAPTAMKAMKAMKAIKATKTIKTVKKAMKERKSKVKYVMNPELDKKPMKTMKGSPKVSPKMKKIKGSGKVSTKVSPQESLKELKEFLAEEKLDSGTGGSSGSGGAGGSIVKTKIAKKEVGKKIVGKKSLVKRRPAAATDSDDKEVGSDDHTRDRMKHYYFMDALQTDTLEPELREMWDKVKGNRKKETALINGVMSKENGKFKPDKNSPAYKELHSKITQSFWRDEQKGIPRALAVVKFKTAAALDEAVASGDVKETEDGGQQFYSWRSITVGKSGQTVSNFTIAKHGGISEASYAELAEKLQKVGWSFQFTSKQQKLSEEGRELPKEATGKMSAAQVALQKVSKQAVTLLTMMKEPSYFKNVFVAQAKEKLSEYLVQIRSLENALASLLVMGKDSDGKTATCDGVLNVLAQTAELLENTFSHIKMCSGVLRGSKTD